MNLELKAKALSEKINKEVILNLERSDDQDLEQLAVWLDAQLEGSECSLPFYKEEDENRLKIVINPLGRFIKDNSFNCQIYKSYNDLSETRYISGGLYPDKLSIDKFNDQLWFPPYLSYGDYDKSTAVERSNYEVFIEKFGNVEGVYEIHGGYNSRSIGILLSTVDVDGMFDILFALEDYPIIDEDHWSATEYEMISEAWESYGFDDIIRELESRFEVDIKEYNSERLYELIGPIMEETGRYPEIEAGGGVYFYTEEICNNIGLDDLDGIAQIVEED